ncbi:hypothetical protein [Micromonospora musae]|uniref:Uncharacterized protein n=1 Tax=Micromonospora musae TaxID=1894970 RepID=A0A3A9Y5T4_9ACTN|nr:hypothetical protein [Micromonospora musae]RKN26927.1 hypothetical protein D7044_29305 [Micromonospora musae]
MKDEFGHLDGSVPVVSRGKQVLQVISDITGARVSPIDEGEGASAVKDAIDFELIEVLTEDRMDISAVTERLLKDANQD